MPSVNNKRLLKNSFYLYIRTFVLLFVSLYTSRLVLEVLGVTNLGIYNLVGGVVMLMSFLQGAQVKATSRFLAFELGKNGDKHILSRTFSLCMTIHFIISIAVILIAETVGLWIINKYTNIPTERLFAANVVYQLSVITFIIQFIKVVYDSVIIAHEEMSVYAYISMVEVILQLALVFVIKCIEFDVLILYSISLTTIAFILLFFLIIYVKKKYKFYIYSWCWDKIDSWKIITFSGWTLLGSSSNTLTQQGVSILMNNFIGLIANTALGFANQVNTAINKFVNSFSTAFNPQITKYYAQKDLRNMHILMRRASKCSFVLCYLLSFPLLINIDYVIHVWLGQSPLYVTDFCQMIIVCAIIDAISGVFFISITATGDVKTYNIWISTSFLLDLLCAALLLYFDVSPVYVFGSRILTRGIVNMFIGLWFCRYKVSFSIKHYLREVLLPIFVVVVISLSIPLFVVNINSEFSKFIVSVLISIIVILTSSFYIILNANERKEILKLIHGFINKKTIDLINN